MPIGLNSMVSRARWFVDAQGGDDGNSGLTPAAPLKTLTALLASWSAGDPAACMGWFREQITLSGQGNILYGVRNTDTMLPATLTRSAKPTWVNTVDTIWEATLGGGVTAYGVAYNWRTRQDNAAGTITTIPFQPYSVLQPGTFGSLAEGQWAQSGTTVQINAIAGTTPNDPAHDYDVCLDQHGIKVSGSDLLVQGWLCGLALQPAGSGVNSMPLYMDGALRCTISNCRSADAGDHVLSSQGGDRGGNLIRMCTAVGQRAGNVVAIFSNVQGDFCDTEDLRIITTKIRAWDGTVWTSAGTISSMVIHGGATLTDNEHRRLRIENPASEANATLAVNGPLAARSVETQNPYDFPIRFFDGRFVNSTSINVGDGIQGSCAFVRTFADGLKQGADTTLVNFNKCYVFMDRSIFGSDLAQGTGGTNNHRDLSLQNDSVVRMNKSMIVDWSMEAAGSNAALIRALGTSAPPKVVYGRGNIFMGARKLVHGTTFAVSQFDLANNIYAGFNTTLGYRDGTVGAWNSGGSAVDASAGSIYLPVVSADRTRFIMGILQPNGAEMNDVRAGGLAESETFAGFTIPRTVGINGRSDDGHYGPFQFGPHAVELLAASVIGLPRVARVGRV